MKPFVIFGAGGHAKAVIEAASAAGAHPNLILDDNASADSFLGIPLLKAKEFSLGAFSFVVAIGDCVVRREKFNHLLASGGIPQTVIHPRACVSPYADIGPGTVIFPMAVVDPCASVGGNCILNIGAIVGHDCQVGHHVHVSASATLGGGANIGDGAWIGLGACVKEGCRIGAGTFVGMGGIVSHDLPPNIRAVSPRRKECVEISSL